LDQYDSQKSFNFDENDLEKVVVMRLSIHEFPLLVGRTVNELTIFGEIQVISITRNNKSFLPTRGTEFENDDVVFIALYSKSASRLKQLLGLI